MDYRKNMSLIGMVQKGGHKEIIAIGTYAYDRKQVAEIAFVVRRITSYNVCYTKLLRHCPAETFPWATTARNEVTNRHPRLAAVT